MKKLIISFALLLVCSAAYSQAQRDVVQLKNGSVIKGQIIEQTPPEKIKIQTADGSIFVYKYDEIEKMTRENIVASNPTIEKPNMNEYGSSFGLGVAIGGGGIIGLPLRFNLTKNIAMEAGVFLRPTMITTETTYTDGWGNTYGIKEETEFRMPAHLSGGLDFFLGDNFKPYNNKVIKNGIMFRAGTTLITDYSETMLTLGWVRERFRIGKKMSSYMFSLGPGILMYEEGSNPWSDQLGDDYPIIPIIYWKLHWNFYVGK